MTVEVCTDSSAAKGIAMRKGLGKVRHIELNKVWVQIEVRRVKGEGNRAAALTKHVAQMLLGLRIGLTNQKDQRQA